MFKKLADKLGVEETSKIVLLKYLLHYYIGKIIGLFKRLTRWI